MSNILRRMRKEVKVRNKNALNPEMYTSLLGSFLICLKIFQRMPLTDVQLNKYYRKQKNLWLNAKVNEDTWMQDICKELKVEMPYDLIGLIVSKYNMLIAPIVKEDDGNYRVLPLSPEGIMTHTLATGKIYPISDTKEKEL